MGEMDEEEEEKEREEEEEGEGEEKEEEREGGVIGAVLLLLGMWLRVEAD